MPFKQYVVYYKERERERERERESYTGEAHMSDKRMKAVSIDKTRTSEKKIE